MFMNLILFLTSFDKSSTNSQQQRELLVLMFMWSLWCDFYKYSNELNYSVEYPYGNTIHLWWGCVCVCGGVVRVYYPQSCASSTVMYFELNEHFRQVKASFLPHGSGSRPG